jgi:hypothetical protein
MGKPAGKRPLGRLRDRSLDNSKMDLREMGWGGMILIDLARRDQWRALVNTVMNLRVPQSVENFLGSSTTGCFSRRAKLYEVS